MFCLIVAFVLFCGFFIVSVVLSFMCFYCAVLSAVLANKPLISP